MKHARDEPATTANKRPRISAEEHDLGSMSLVYRNEKTIGGYDLGECISAYQKHIRRGEVDKALKFAFEIFLFILMKDGGRVLTRFLNRTKTIGMEDISVANVAALLLVDSRLQILEKAKRGVMPSTAEKKALVDIVYALAVSKHCRIPSHYNAAFCNDSVLATLEAEDPEIFRQLGEAKKCPQPEKRFPFSAAEKNDADLVDLVNCLVYCLEQRWGAGFAPLKRLFDRKTGPTKHSNSARTAFLALDVFGWFVRVAHPERYTGDCRRVISKFLETMTRWCKLMINNAEGPPLCLRNAYLALILSDKIDWTREAETPPIDLDPDQLCRRNLDRQAISGIDDYAIDMHTRRGRSAGKDKKVFALEGSIVSDEDTDLVDPLYKRLYLLTKGVINTEVKTDFALSRSQFESMIGDDGDTESGTFELTVRAQLVTSSSKQDTYFATMKQARDPFTIGQRVFVKGPFAREQRTSAQTAIILNSLKRLLSGLHHQDMCCLDLVPTRRLDAFDQPLGFRTSIAPDAAYSFLVCSDLIVSAEESEDAPIPTRTHSSKLWPPTRVVDFDALARRGDLCVALPSDLPSDALRQFVLALCFRRIFRVPDCAARNFVYVPASGRVYSVDEDSTVLGRGDPPAGDKLVPNATQRLVVLSYIQQHTEDLIGQLKSWRTTITQDDEAKALLAQLPSHTQVNEDLGILIESNLKCAFP